MSHGQSERVDQSIRGEIPTLRDIDFNSLADLYVLEVAMQREQEREVVLAHEMLAAVSIFCWIREVLLIDRRKGERRQGVLDRRARGVYRSDRREPKYSTETFYGGWTGSD